MMRSVAVLTLLGAFATAAATPANPDQAHVNERVSHAVAPRSIDETIGKATRWLQANPADVRKHEIMEVAEEIIFFYSLWALASAPAEREIYRDQIATRHAAISAFNDELQEGGFHLLGTWGPLTYPPLTHIIARMDMDARSFRAIIDDMVAAHPYLYPTRDAMALWIAVYMERLGYTPTTPVSILVERSTLRQDTQARFLLDRLALDQDPSPERQKTIQLIYDITHEVFALTDFGALPAPAAMVARRDEHALLFDHAIRWAMHASAIDILAELLVSAHLLGLHNLASAPEAVSMIVRSQQVDGSFGVTNPDRPNGRRHGVLTCLLALKTVGARQHGR